MKTLLFVSLLSMVSIYAHAAEEWVVLTAEQRQIVSRDLCAAAAVEASASLIADEIQEAGVDFPDHLYLFDLYVSEQGQFYVVTFREESSITVTTKKSNAACTAEASRIQPE